MFDSFPGAIALHRATYGQGIGPIFLDSVICTGSETRLADCPQQGIASHDCSHYEDAGVICPGGYTNKCTHSHRMLCWHTLCGGLGMLWELRALKSFNKALSLYSQTKQTAFVSTHRALC